jgi:hypothetical protein
VLKHPFGGVRVPLRELPDVGTDRLQRAAHPAPVDLRSRLGGFGEGVPEEVLAVDLGGTERVVEILGRDSGRE